MSTYPNNTKPSLVTAIAVMTLLSGIVNIFWGLVLSGSVLATLVGVICTPLTILPTILGVFEIIFAARLLGDQPQPVRPSPTLAAFQIASILAGNVFSMIVGILVLVFYSDLTVKAYFEEMNGTRVPVPAEPALPAVPQAPSEPEPPSADPDAPQSPRRPRKVA
jgi:hypothetical protein